MLNEAYIESVGEQRQDNLRRAISCYTAVWQTIMQRTLSTSADLFKLMNRCLQALSAHSDSVEELEQEAKLYRNMIQDMSIYTPHWPLVLTRLVSTLPDRYNRTGRSDDLEQSIEILQDALPYIPTKTPVFLMALNNLSRSLFLRWAYKGQMGDLQQAITLTRQAIGSSISTDNTANLPVFLNTLGTSLRSMYSITGQLTDIDQAIEAFEEATKCAETANMTFLYTWLIQVRDSLCAIPTIHG